MAKDSKTSIQHNILIQLENSMLMYGVYNIETLEKLIDTVHQIHSTTSSHERLSAGQQSSLTLRSLYVNALGLQHYSINLTTLFESSVGQIHCFIQRTDNPIAYLCNIN